MAHRILVFAVALALLLTAGASGAWASGGGTAAFAEDLSPVWVLPFGLLLVSIATLPLVAPHWWESNRHKGYVAGAAAALVLVLLASEWGRGGDVALGHAGLEYVSFIALLGALYVISGGILVTGDIRATPRNNTLFLALGGVLANAIGTTGASMLLIRPVLRVNSERKNTAHTVIFFIFVVSNVGGCLTPLGDPPLFLGFLEGVPFEWTLRLLPEWAFLMAGLLGVYYVVDTIQHAREAPEDIRHDDTLFEPIRVRGLVNLVFLLGVMVAILVPALAAWPAWVQVAGMAAMALLSLAATPRTLREENVFTWHPIVEVAVLFAGIFVAMIPALQYLQVHGSQLGLSEPWHYFVGTGLLSSFLDNAPTYLTFVSVAAGAHAITPRPGEVVAMARGDVPADLLIAISLGAVFMGAMTYIGNGPNFMVKSIAERAGRRMPSFLAYMVWSAAFLGPLLVLVAVLFL